jgi:hypothetical protein
MVSGQPNESGAVAAKMTRPSAESANCSQPLVCIVGGWNHVAPSFVVIGMQAKKSTENPPCFPGAGAQPANFVNV